MYKHCYIILRWPVWCLLVQWTWGCAVHVSPRLICWQLWLITALLGMLLMTRHVRLIGIGREIQQLWLITALLGMLLMTRHVRLIGIGREMSDWCKNSLVSVQVSDYKYSRIVLLSFGIKKGSSIMMILTHRFKCTICDSEGWLLIICIVDEVS